MPELHFTRMLDRGQVYLVLADPMVGVYGTWPDLETAAKVAHSIDGYVVALPIVADMRQSKWTVNPDRTAYEEFKRG